MLTLITPCLFEIPDVFMVGEYSDWIQCIGVCTNNDLYNFLRTIHVQEYIWILGKILDNFHWTNCVDVCSCNNFLRMIYVDSN